MTAADATWDAEVEAVARRLAQHAGLTDDPVGRVSRVLTHMVKKMHSTSVEDENLQSLIDGWAAALGGAVLILNASEPTAAPTYVEWFDPGVMGPRDEDRDGYDPREDLDPGGHEADLQSVRRYGR